MTEVFLEVLQILRMFNAIFNKRFSFFFFFFLKRLFLKSLKGTEMIVSFEISAVSLGTPASCNMGSMSPCMYCFLASSPMIKEFSSKF